MIFTQEAPLTRKWISGRPFIRSNWNLKMLIFEESGSRRTRRKTTRSTVTWRTNNQLNPLVATSPKSNPGHVDGRRVQSPLRHSKSLEADIFIVTLLRKNGSMKLRHCWHSQCEIFQISVSIWDLIQHCKQREEGYVGIVWRAGMFQRNSVLCPPYCCCQVFAWKKKRITTTSFPGPPKPKGEVLEIRLEGTESSGSAHAEICLLCWLMLVWSSTANCSIVSRYKIPF